MNDDFYIGHLALSPDRLARHVRWVVAGTVLVALALMVGVAARQTPAEPGSFEYGIERDFEGVLRRSPLPTLRSVSASGAVTNYLLVGKGKHGLPAFAQGHDGERVRFRASLIQKGPAVRVEMNDAKSFTALGPATASDAPERTVSLGRVVLTGELVDTKCHLGVMRPATGKVHRACACAVRCLSGGVPPGLLVRDGHGGGVVVMLAGNGGGPLRLDPQWAARSLRATGDLSLRKGVPVPGRDRAGGRAGSASRPPLNDPRGSGVGRALPWRSPDPADVPDHPGRKNLRRRASCSAHLTAPRIAPLLSPTFT